MNQWKLAMPLIALLLQFSCLLAKRTAEAVVTGGYSGGERKIKITEEKFMRDVKNLKGYDDGKVHLVTKEFCPYSIAMRRWLDRAHIPYSDYVVDAPGHRDIRGDLKIPNHTFPIVFRRGKIIGDYGLAIQNPELLELRKRSFVRDGSRDEDKSSSITEWDD